jgi:periplasmic divalent cation tolerance protein
VTNHEKERGAFLVCLVTTSSVDEARRIGRAIIEERLAACCNIVPRVESIYRWEGKVEEDSEALCIIKTRRELFGALRERVIELHGYDVPEVIALDIADGSEAYLEWLEGACGPSS